jgi:hypothetical protein
MGTVILDDELKAKLNGLNQPLEIRDTSGKLVGRFIPEDEYLRMIYNEAKLAFAAEESEEAAKGIVRKWDGTNGKTTAEVLANLKQLAERLEAGR